MRPVHDPQRDIQRAEWLLRQYRDVALDRPSQSQLVVLLGMPTVGKTSIGRELGKLLGVPFVDGDDEVQRVTGRSAREVIESDGMDSFREVEEAVTLGMLQPGPAVFALGGGAWLKPSVRPRAHAIAVTVWLDADVDVLYRRASAAGRVMARRGVDAFTAEVRSRAPLYREATVHLRLRDQPVADSVRQVLRALEQAPAGVQAAACAQPAPPGCARSCTGVPLVSASKAAPGIRSLASRSPLPMTTVGAVTNGAEMRTGQSGGRPTGVMLPYSMPDRATATSRSARETRRAPSWRRTRPLRSVLVFGSITQTASWVAEPLRASSTRQFPAVRMSRP